MKSLPNDLVERFARFHFEEINKSSWDELPELMRTELIDAMWRKLFKDEREFSDPLYYVCDSRPTASDKSFYKVDEARAEARRQVEEGQSYRAVVEVVTRHVTGYYERVRRSVREECDEE